MAPVIHWISVTATNEVKSMNIVNVTIIIVINAVTRNFGFIHPHIGRQIWMGIVNSSIYDTNDDR